MGKRRTLSLAQVYLLCWADQKDREVAGAGIATTNRIPTLLELPDRRRIDEPPGVSMAAAVGLVRRGLMSRHGLGGSFITITDAGRAALRASATALDEMVRLTEERQRIANESC